MLRLTCCILLLFVFGYFPGYAGVLQGTVRDSKGAALPFATVFVSGTANGTVANESGVYSLNLEPGAYVVSCQYIGFQRASFSFNIGKDEHMKHDFRLQEQGLSIGEVVVHSSDEDPAYRIIREAIKKRAFHLAQVQQFQTSIYLKGVMRTRKTPTKILGQKIDPKDMGVDSNGKGVLYLCEEVADYYAQRDPKRSRTVIHSVKESGDPMGMGFAQFPPVISFYANDVLSLNNSRALISPISDGAMAHYKYKLEGEFKEGRNTIYKIKVIPKHAYSPLCFGTIYIVDGDWAIHSLSLATSARYGLELLDTLRIDQVFLPLRKDVWVIKNQLLYPTFNIFGFDLTGNFITVYDNQKVNQPVPDTIFHKKVISSYDQAANKKDSNYWEETRPLPLETDEARDYRYKDSLRIATENPQRLDSLRRLSNKVHWGDFILGGMDFSDSGYRNKVHITSLLDVVNFNSVEGFNLAPELSWTHRLDTGEQLSLRTALRYGFANTHFNGIARLRYTHEDKHWLTKSWMLAVTAGQYVFQYDRHNPIAPLYNTFSTLLFHYNPLKIFECRTAAVELKRNQGNGLQWSLQASFEQRLPLANSSDYSWAKSNTGFYSDNLPTTFRKGHTGNQKAFLLHAGIAWQPGVRYVDFPNYRQPTSSEAPEFSLQYEKGISGLLGSDVNFDSWRASVTGQLSIQRFGSLGYQIAGGGFLNKNWLGIADLNHPFAGDDAFSIDLSMPYLRGFQVMPMFRFSNDADAYAEAHLEYNMLGFLSNKIPGLRQAQWYFVLGANSFYAGDQLYYNEVFVSLDHIGYKMLRPLRVDFVRGWDQNRQSYEGIRFSLQLNGSALFRKAGEERAW
ncbi:MAG: carboxypeptidase-like regulatory domain-containing protein [Bacteroidetes bacterium]|nr:carboxypeptidase-like regulatory domain-containing protein [Bacteroidota bacterium]